jgi:endonuclease/exonuclease/phosphatase family metal-dependent hydrolase
MKSKEADIWVLTETHQIATLDGYHSSFSETVSWYHKQGEACVAILSRYPILRRIPTWNMDMTLCVEVDTPETSLFIYGSIIPYRDDKRRDKSARQWEEHRKSIEGHRADWVGLREAYPKHEVIAAGDYNQSRDGSGWYESAVVVEELSQALTAAGVRCLTEENYRRSRGLSRGNVDHICGSERLARSLMATGVWEGSVDGRQVSDHNGVFADFAHIGTDRA